MPAAFEWLRRFNGLRPFLGFNACDVSMASPFQWLCPFLGFNACGV